MKSMYPKDIESEYQEFLRTDLVTPPSAISERIRMQVLRDLNPSTWRILSRLSGVHFLVGVITLTVCPQFGLRFFGEGIGLMKYFLHLGTYGCMAACGAFFVGSSVFIAALALSRDEVRKFRDQRSLQLASVILVSLGAFLMAQAEILFGFALVWAAGSFLGGLAAIEIGWQLKIRSATV